MSGARAERSESSERSSERGERLGERSERYPYLSSSLLSVTSSPLLQRKPGNQKKAKEKKREIPRMHLISLLLPHHLALNLLNRAILFSFFAALCLALSFREGEKRLL